MKKIITIIILLCLSFGFAQTKDIDSLTVQLAFQKTDTIKILTSLKLVNELYETKDYNLALKYISQTEKLALQLNYKKGLAQIAYLKALIYTHKEDYLNAMNQFTDAKLIFSQLRDTLAIAHINNRIGLIEISQGHYQQGLTHALSAIKTLEHLDLKNELKATYGGLAQVYSINEKYDVAINYYLKQLKIEEIQGDKNNLITINKNLAALYALEKEHRKAINYYEKILTLNYSENDSITCDILPKISRQYLQFRDFNKAGNYLSQSLKLSRSTKNTNALIETLNTCGELNYKLNKTGLAEHQLLEAYTLLRNSNNTSERLKNYKLLKTVDSTQRDYQRALNWQEQFYRLKDSLARVKLAVTTKQLDSNEPPTIVEDSPKTATLTITQAGLNPINSYLTNKTEFNKLRLVTYILLAAFAIVTTFLVLFYFNNNRRIRYTHELEAKTKKIELQNEAILEQSAHLENINNVKDKLFSIVSHDLKDSLTSINGFIELLKDGSLTRQEFDRLLPELSENANNATLLLFNLLNWSKSQMESLEPQGSLFDIREVFHDKIKLIEHKLTEKNVKLINNTRRDFVYADYSMVEIIIQNLLANAIKFSNSGDKITVSNFINNGYTVISIEDTGIGISQENLSKLFLNHSFSTIGTNNEKGTGLGLSICKELVELNHGKIWVESQLNIGSTFFVQLPKSKQTKPELSLG